MAKPIGTLGTIETLTIGGYVFTDLSTLITLVAGGGGATNYVATMRVPNGVAGYAVTGGKTLTIKATLAYQAVVASTMRLFYSDNDAGMGTNNALTNEVAMGGGTGTVCYATAVNSVLGVPQTRNPNFQVLAGKYPGVASGGGGTDSFQAFAYGYEV